MKKTITIISAILLLLCFVTSCNQDEIAVFKAISNATAKSEFTCMAFAGYNEDKIYITTSNKGLVELSIDAATHKATITKDNLNPALSDENVYFDDAANKSYALDAYGKIYEIDLTDGSSDATSNTALHITNGGFAITADKKLYKLGGFTPVEEGDGFKIADYWEAGKDVYFKKDATPSYIYSNSDFSSALIETNDAISKIKAFVAGDNKGNVVLLEDGKYKLCSNSNIDTPIGEIAGLPIASCLFDNKVIIAENGKIQVYDGSSIETIDAAWAEPLCSADISQFFEINNELYCINELGDMIYIDIDGNTAFSVF